MLVQRRTCNVGTRLFYHKSAAVSWPVGPVVKVMMDVVKQPKRAALASLRGNRGGAVAMH